MAAVRRLARLRPLVPPLLPSLLFVVLGAALFGSTGRDDTYITYWPAQTLLRFGEILSYNGERLEQSSSLLHVLLLAATSWVTGISVPAAGWALGVLGGVACIVLAQVAASRAEPGAATLAGVLVGTTAYVTYWSFSGLETPIAAALLLLVVVAVARVLDRGRPGDWTLAVGSIAAFTLVRPEAGLVALATTAGVLGWAVLARCRRQVLAHGALATRAGLIATVLVTVALVVVARLAYFGDAVPQPVHAKVRGVRLGPGAEYAWHWLRAPYVLLPLLVLAVAALVGAARRPGARASSIETVLWFALAAQLGSVVTAGGDWMEAGRLLVPGLAVAATLTAVVVVRLPLRRLATVGVAAGLAVVQLAGVWHVAAGISTGRPVWTDLEPIVPVADAEASSRFSWFERSNRVHQRDAVFVPVLSDVVERLHAATGRPVVVATGQAGMVPYYVFEAQYPDVRLIDVGRLTGESFEHCLGGTQASPFGFVMSYGYWFTHIDECRLALPDLLFGLGSFESDPAVAARFTLLYQQPHQWIEARSRWLPGVPTDVAQFVAVRNDLASLLPPADDR